jgi:hypothetical protein
MTRNIRDHELSERVPPLDSRMGVLSNEPGWAWHPLATSSSVEAVACHFGMRDLAVQRASR